MSAPDFQAAGCSRCPSCQAEFTCHLRAGLSTCWCFQLPHVMPLNAEAHCLCPACLEQQVARQVSPATKLPVGEQESR